MADNRLKAVATAEAYNQGTIANLDDAMTRRLVASTVLTESYGGNLDSINRLGYVGRYQAGAAWLVDAGYIDMDRYRAGKDSMSNRDWERGGGQLRFMQNAENWRNGLSLDQYLQSPELQDRAFRTNSNAAYQQAVRNGLLGEGDSPERVAGFLKARHLSGYEGARNVIRNGPAVRDENGTSNYDYFHDITRNRDGLNEFIGRDRQQGQTQDGQTPGRERTTGQTERPQSRDAIADGVLRQGERGADVKGLQASLNTLGIQDANGNRLAQDSDYGKHTREAVENFQRANGLKVDGIAGKDTLTAIGNKLPEGKVTVDASGVTGPDAKIIAPDKPVSEKPGTDKPLISDAKHPNHALFEAISAKLPPGTRPEVAANITLQSLENGITGPDKLSRVDISGSDAFVQGSVAGDRAKVDLTAPTPTLQQMSDHMTQQSQRVQQQPPLEQQRTQILQ